MPANSVRDPPAAPRLPPECSFQARLSGNSRRRLWAGPRMGFGSAARRRPAASLAGGGGDLVAVEFEQVVGRRDEPPFRPAGGSSAALEASHLAVVFQLAKDGLDRGLAPPVERTAVRAGEHAAHEVIKPARPSRARAATQAGVR